MVRQRLIAKTRPPRKMRGGFFVEVIIREKAKTVSRD